MLVLYGLFPTQFALAVILLGAAGLLVRSFRPREVSPGQFRC
jgi:hypothetical protein